MIANSPPRVWSDEAWVELWFMELCKLGSRFTLCAELRIGDLGLAAVFSWMDYRLIG